ncbi:putative death-receptor fusion protein-domain-containing protein [Dactylonectria estremocensis]|uniref:Death-receptor fusion protein-domain-containing protein n=1 Tax=Dactylonectria estremocensis TaxID=1079267 RepID=A0A9P9FIZ8_9HYPO|nr:putative death-receptor fusion protein-domain-containing protein [Dactylonectria estremocensis]
MRDNAQQVDDLIANSNHISKWVEEQPTESQASWAESIFVQLLENAAQPRSSSGNSCVKLCGFVEQSSKSHSQVLRVWSFTRNVTLRLFNFYIEWNESDNHRSMRLVLELLPRLIRRNPDEEMSQSTKRDILDNLVAIVARISAKPLAKSAIKALDHLLTRDSVSVDEIYSSYVTLQQREPPGDGIEVWKSLFFELFHWMRLHFVCPVAGRFIFVLYRALRHKTPEKATALTIEIWHQWLLEALTEDPSILEPIKNYVFLSLFKADKRDALLFLRRMNNYEAVSANTNLDLDIPALLQLAALETGKKVGLVEEPALSGGDRSSDEAATIILDEKVLESVLAHPSHEVRSFAFSLLVSSPLTTRPYSPKALDLLRKHMATFFAESDAKFRNDISSKVRDMFKRVRGAIFVLKRSIPRAAAQIQKDAEAANSSTSKPNPVIYRANLISLPEAQLVEYLGDHERFLFWYIDFLCSELTPTASYQRHIASLKAVKFILRMEGEKSKTWETSDDQRLLFDRFDGTWLRALSDLIMDPFDDVREHSAAVLKQIFSDDRHRCFILMSTADKVNASEELAELLRRAEELARRTARADHSDGVARACQLLYRFSDGEQSRLSLLSTLISGLETKLVVAEKDLGRAVLEAPVHGDFSSLCYAWQVVSELQFSENELQAVQGLQSRLVVCGERVWAAVRGILCDDSPEGHLPRDLEEVDGLDTKDILSYSFRAVHEASNLMRALILSIKQESSPGRIHPSREAYERIGNLSFTQLSALRHRGAFTTVSLTFATCCQLAKHLDQGAESQQGPTLLEQWYNGTMDAIFAQVSTTRRSAGIPAMMTGVLSANASSPSFEQVMAKLMEVASLEARVSETDGTNLPQVHAYNCLKDIFKSSYLTAVGNKSEKYLLQCLELAANGLKSELWAIRNCGLIFLRSLIDCLFGSHESKSTMEAGWDGKANRIAYHRYPSLPNVLLNLLKTGHEMMAPTAMGSAAAESVFPALDIIRRAGPPELLRDELQVYIAKYIASPVWHVRDIAARTLCSCLLHDKWLDVITALAAESLQSTGGNAQNHVHGVLLSLKYVVERLQEVMQDRLQGDMPRLGQFLKEYWGQIQGLDSPEITGAYLEVVNLMRSLTSLEDTAERVQFEFPTFGKPESALLRAQRVTHDVYSAYESKTPAESLRNVLLAEHMGVNSLVVGLKTLPRLWAVSKLSDADLTSFCDLYLDICLVIGPAEPRVVALQNLTDLLYHSLKTDNTAVISTLSLSQVWNSLHSGMLNPGLANAVIRISGCIIAILRQRQSVSAAGLQNWGHMVADAGLDDKDFDTRLAAAESLSSFFSIIGSAWAVEECLPALLAVYDSLNDDDDDIRDIGSAAAKSILGRPLVPIEAANQLAAWMAQHFGNCAAFRQIVASRIMGDTRFPHAGNSKAKFADQLREAMKFDDSLFVIEEQNLFIDEVRECQRWVAAFENMSWSLEDKVLKHLTSSTHEGLLSMGGLTSEEDGPLGYSSKPQVFAILSRVVQAAAALTRYHPDPSHRATVEGVSRLFQSGKGHISGLLLLPLVERIHVRLE